MRANIRVRRSRTVHAARTRPPHGARARSCSSPASGPSTSRTRSVVDESRRRRRATFQAVVDVIEWLGNEQYAYVPFEAPEASADQLKELARELDSDSMRTQLVVVARPDESVREGEEAEFWIDTPRMLLFDPASGDNLTLKTPAEAGATT